MVKQRKVTEARKNYYAAFGYSTIKGCRRKRHAREKALKKMLTPGRTGPVSPEEIGNGSDTKEPGLAGNGSNACTRNSHSPGTYDNDDRAKEFLSTGRAGRRNALTEILGHPAQTGMLDLPDRFQDLSVETDQPRNGGEGSNSSATSAQQG